MLDPSKPRIDNCSNDVDTLSRKVTETSYLPRLGFSYSKGKCKGSATSIPTGEVALSLLPKVQFKAVS